MVKSEKIIPSITPTESTNIPLGNKEKAKQKLEEMLPRQMKLVEGTFVNEETKGAPLHLDLPQKCKGIPPFKMTLEDGKTYRIPLWVANHLNGLDDFKDVLNPDGNKRINSCAFGRSTYAIGKDEFPKLNMDSGSSVPVIGADYIKRFRFVPTAFAE